MRLVKMIDGVPNHREWHYGYNFTVGTIRRVDDHIADRLLKTPKFVEIESVEHLPTKRGPGRPRKSTAPQSALLPTEKE